MFGATSTYIAPGGNDGATDPNGKTPGWSAGLPDPNIGIGIAAPGKTGLIIPYDGVTEGGYVDRTGPVDGSATDGGP